MSKVIVIDLVEDETARAERKAGTEDRKKDVFFAPAPGLMEAVNGGIPETMSSAYGALLKEYFWKK